MGKSTLSKPFILEVKTSWKSPTHSLKNDNLIIDSECGGKSPFFGSMTIAIPF